MAVDEVFRGQDVIWSLEFLSEQEILFAERVGKLRSLDLSTKKSYEIQGAPKVSVGGQGGLHDLALDPEFKKNAKLYLCYAVEALEGRRTTALAVAQLDLQARALRNLKEIFRAEPALKTDIHFGCRIGFDRQKFLYLSVGERNERNFAQDPKAHLGKVLRFDRANQVEILSLGHRNPQGLAVHPETDNVFVNEHGPRGGDEINLIKPGANYGWPIVTHGREYWGPSIGEGSSKAGMEPPLKFFVPSIAPSSLMIYSGKIFKKWKGDFFSGALALTHLNRIVFDKNWKPTKEERFLESLGERIRDVKESPDGQIYLATDSGKILRLSIFNEPRN